MSADARPPHAVLVRAPAKFAPAAVAGVLARRAKAPALDFIAPARRAWGVVAEALPAEEAEILAQELTAAGQDALAAPASLLESPAEPVAVSKASLSAEGFEIVAARANALAERLAWTRLAAICAAGLEERTSRKVTETTPVEMGEQAVRLGLTMATGIPLMKSAKKTEKIVETRDRALALDLIFLEPARRARIDARAFDFSLLGDKMGYGAEVNFLALVQELAARAPKALQGKGTRALLGRRPAAESLYESFDDLGREERWLQTLAALRAAL
jgi:hypothetical protein